MTNTFPTIPTGTVTILFTNIEGSTRLWQEKSQAMALSHARHDAILRGGGTNRRMKNKRKKPASVTNCAACCQKRNLTRFGWKARI
jgi:hypothetical protein